MPEGFVVAPLFSRMMTRIGITARGARTMLFALVYESGLLHLI